HLFGTAGHSSGFHGRASSGLPCSRTQSGVARPGDEEEAGIYGELYWTNCRGNHAQERRRPGSAALYRRTHRELPEAAPARAARRESLDHGPHRERRGRRTHRQDRVLEKRVPVFSRFPRRVRITILFVPANFRSPVDLAVHGLAQYPTAVFGESR